nr:metal ABC transporter substrate-binding protein [uncultured Mediterraneibacter sp.]
MKRSEVRRKRIWTALVTGALVIGGLLTGCGTEQKAKQETVENKTKDQKISVVTTIFPQYDFVRQIAGDSVDLKMLLKPGEETHSYEPTPQDIIAIQNSDLFIYVGGENDSWVEDILESMPDNGRKTLKLADCVDTVEEEHVEGMKEERGHDHEEHDHEEHGHDSESDTHLDQDSDAEEEHLLQEQEVQETHSDADSEAQTDGEHGNDSSETVSVHEIDEHVWTSPKNAEKIVEHITDLLCEADEAHAAEYQTNAADYEQQLEELDQEFRDVVDHSERNLLIFGDRFPFRYFADEYGLDYYAAFSGCASDTEPSAATMAFLINKVKEEQVPTVLKMELSNDNISKAIAEAAGTDVKVFYSCHNLTAEEFENGETYLSMMKKNVETLKEVLN